MKTRCPVVLQTEKTEVGSYDAVFTLFTAKTDEPKRPASPRPPPQYVSPP